MLKILVSAYFTVSDQYGNFTNTYPYGNGIYTNLNAIRNESLPSGISWHPDTYNGFGQYYDQQLEVTLGAPIKTVLIKKEYGPFTQPHLTPSEGYLREPQAIPVPVDKKAIGDDQWKVGAVYDYKDGAKLPKYYQSGGKTYKLVKSYISINNNQKFVVTEENSSPVSGPYAATHCPNQAEPSNTKPDGTTLTCRSGMADWIVGYVVGEYEEVSNPDLKALDITMCFLK